MNPIEIIQGRAFISNRIMDVTIHVKDGIISKIEYGSISKFGNKVLKLPLNYLILPGIIDIHTHFRDWELSYKETLSSGTAAAAYGGVVLAIDMPNTKPPLNNLVAIKRRFHEAMSSVYTDYWVYSGIPNNIKELEKIIKYGYVAGFKIYPEDLSSKVLKKALKLITAHKMLIILHSETYMSTEKCLFFDLGSRYVCRSLASMIESTEYISSLIRDEEMNRKNLHITHIPYYDLAVKARVIGATCDTCLHYILLDSDDEACSCRYKINPPLTPYIERLKLLKALIDGSIDAITTDHAPHTLGDKSLPPTLCPSGIASIEYAFKLLFTYVVRNIMSLSKYVKLVSENPARILRLEHYLGSIDEGKLASFTIVDVKGHGRVDGPKYSKACCVGFEGYSYEGEFAMTIVRGCIAHEIGVGVHRCGSIIPLIIEPKLFT